MPNSKQEPLHIDNPVNKEIYLTNNGIETPVYYSDEEIESEDEYSITSEQPSLSSINIDEITREIEEIDKEIQELKQELIEITSN